MTLIIPSDLVPNETIKRKAEDFLKVFSPFEIAQGASLILNFDRKSGAYYILCHLGAATLVKSCDLNAALDAEDDEDAIYKLNRDMTFDEIAYLQMKQDALEGRTFEDLVIEYDTSYRDECPLKVYGGQHRIKAVEEAINDQGTVPHGVRVYFDLSRDQKVEIATVNNTSIAVPNDLLDRMRESILGTELRDWCQAIGLLNPHEDFADRKRPDVPTVRIARTLIVNFYLGLQSSDNDFHQPILCKTGGMDDSYNKRRNTINWKDTQLLIMGKEFARLHKVQQERVKNRNTDNNAEFARKALSFSVVASWAYASGLFQRDNEALRNHYALPDSVTAPKDPLNTKALSSARHKVIDPETYRGLGTRTSAGELGRMLEVFILQAEKGQGRGITPNLPDAAIQSYVAKKAARDRDEALKKI